MKITWLGHDAFLFEGSAGIKLLTDPYVSGSYDGSVGYEEIKEVVDVVTTSHEQHPDHFDKTHFGKHPNLVRGAGERTVAGIPVKGISTYHDKSNGSERGTNTIFIFEIDGIRVCHCGDLGHLLSGQQYAEIGPVDVLMIPVGGYFTIDHKEAWEITKKIAPKIIIPVHYKTDVLGFPLDTVDVFLKGKKNTTMVEDVLELEKEQLPEPTQIVVFQKHRL
ncbi:MBL fold metallo-hydrolase [candidate division KSB1 bacterium]|nr:MBL fold metallo-hydrolase [candidate division KSB1 bacterium]